MKPRIGVGLLGALDAASHFVLDPYINARPFGHALPGGGRLQLWQWHLCQAWANAEEGKS